MDSLRRVQLRTLVVAPAVGGIGLLVGFGLVLATQFGLLAAGVEVTPILLIVVSLVSVQGIAFGGVALGYLAYRGLDAEYLGVRVPTLRDLLFAVAGYVGAFGAVLLVGMLVMLSGVEPGTNRAAELGRRHPETLLLLIPASFLMIGPGEELLFRGVVQNRIREVFSPVPGIALASIVFAAIHYLALTGGAGARLVTIAILFFPSAVFGTVYELTDNLVVPALVHGAYNATLFSLLYISVKFAQLGIEPGGAGVL
jgi:hypothetical protein